ncbi:MAG: bifunctional glycoside hydrolase 114/ polysaccharide deacetylase family protein, partial [Aquificaceae bacterium]
MVFIITLLCLFSPLDAYAKDMSVGFIFKDKVPEEALYLFDWLVVDPDSRLPQKLREERFYIKKKRAKLIAYVSVGELEPTREYYKEAKKEWILGDNPAWKSKIADVRRDDYVDFYFEKAFNRLKEYDGFFLDTLDSYQRVLKKEEERKEYEKALVKLIKRLRNAYPDKLILINRGFEIVDFVKNQIDAFVAESLFYGLDLEKGLRYKKMKEEDTKWLLDRLNYVKSLGLKVIVIDYVDPKNKKLQREVAKKIYDLGFIPYVSDRLLYTVGTSIYQIKPRKVLLIHDGKLDPAYSDVHRLVQTWLEYYGYVPVLRNINQVMESEEFKDFMADQYAAIILSLYEYKNPSQLYKWLLGKKEEGLKIFFIGNMPFVDREDYLASFGIKRVGTLEALNDYKIEESSFSFFEIQPSLGEIPMLLVDKPLYYIKARAKGKVFYPLAITEWGGYALEGSFYRYVREDLFVVNPLDLIKVLLNPDFPVPDVTTESGRRILTAHIDGDASFGVADFNPNKNLMEVIRDEIIKRYPIPHTVSIIEGEIAPYGLYPGKSPKLEEIARSIFALDNVEMASHSFSHPYKWQEIERAKELIEATDGYNLNIPNYTFNLEREIFGSIEYINTRLSPNPEKKVKVFLWTGDCIPSTQAIKLTYRAGVYNLNGGYTWINNKEPFYSYISPMGLDRDGYFQVYSPVQNKNIYTNLWRDYYGYVRTIETFQLTEKPRRLKPIAIYYHMYSGQKVASLKALKEVYEYALSQPVNPMFASEYAQRVLEFRNMAIAEDIRDGSLVIRSEGNLKTLRIDNKKLYPLIFESRGVLGFKHVNDSLYISLDNSGDYRIVFGGKEPDFYLVSSNGQIISSTKEGKNVSFKIKSYLPLEYEIHVRENCEINIKPKPDIIEKRNSLVKVKYKEGKEG